MQSNSLERFYTSAIRWILYAVPFLPLYISSSLLFPYITGRNFAFRILIEIAFVCWAGLVALNREYMPRLSPAVKAVSVFIAVIFVADIFGVNFYRSFWSNYERMEGFLMLSHMAAFFILMVSVFREREWKIFGNLVIVGSLAVAFWAILQKLGVYTSIQGGARVDGTIGNPAYLAAYLVLALTVTLLYFWNAAPGKWRYFYGAVALLHLLVIYFSATRGAILGLLAAAIVFSFLSLFVIQTGSDHPRLRKFAWGMLGVAVLVPALFWTLKNAQFIQQSPVLSRFATISLTERTTQSRLMIWNMAWQGIKEHPVLGWGQENFNLIFNKYYNPHLWAQEPWFDRSHNIVFDWLSNAGFVGLISYLSLFAAAFYSVWRAYRMQIIHGVIAATVASGLLAYFLQNLFVFDNFNSYFLFFGLLGYSHFLWTRGTESQHRSASPAKDPSWSITVVTVFGIVFLVGGYFLHAAPILEGRTLISAMQASGAGKAPLEVLPQFQKAFSYRTFGDREAMEQFAQYAGRVADVEQVPAKDRRKIISVSISEMERLTTRFPEDLRFRLFLASLGYQKAAQIDPSYFPKAEQEFKRAMEQSPTKHQAYFGLIQLYLAMGQLDKVLPLAEKVYQMDPAYPEAQLFYAASSIYGGRPDLAEKALYDHPNLFNPPPVVHIMNAYDVTRKMPLFVSILKKRIAENPNNAQDHATLASAYARLNDRTDAIREAREAARLDPQQFANDVEAFIKQLEQK